MVSDEGVTAVPATPRNILEHRSNRLKLAPQREPYWVKIDQGVFIGYYRTATGAGNWWARKLIPGTKRYAKAALGIADDHRDANGIDCLTYFAAADKARGIADTHARQDVGAPIKLPTVADAVREYMKWFSGARKSAAQTQNVIDTHILPELGSIALAELRTARLRSWLDKVASTPARRRKPRIPNKITPRQPAAPLTEAQQRARRATANRVLNVLRAILNFAFKHGLVADDTPWRRIESFRGADEPSIRFLTDAEARRLINASRPDLRELVKGALFTGVRFGELAALRCGDFNRGTGLVYVRPGKSGKGRHLPLNAEGLDFFRRLTAGRGGEEFVFRRGSGAPWLKNQYVKPLAEACAAAAIAPAISFHDLRHTYASILAQAGADLLTISKLLGHADTRVTSRHYAHLTDKTLGAAVRALLPSFGHEPEGNVAELSPS